MSTMMMGPKTSCVADSGYGVKIAGFFGQAKDFANNLKTLQDNLPGAPDLIASWEQEGYVTFLGVENEDHLPTIAPKLTFYRREIDKFFSGLQMFLCSLRAQKIARISVCGSGGSLCLSVVYHPAPGGSE